MRRLMSTSGPHMLSIDLLLSVGELALELEENFNDDDVDEDEDAIVDAEDVTTATRLIVVDKEEEEVPVLFDSFGFSIFFRDISNALLSSRRIHGVISFDISPLSFRSSKKKTIHVD